MRDAFVLPGTIEWRAFLDSAAEKANPFLADAEKDAELAGRWASWRTPPEDLYLRILSRYGAGLASLGALAFAPGPKGNSAVTLTPVGRWLYRKAEAWALPEPVRDSLIVGADFTVTPLLDDADARMDLAAFAEPEGRGFRITRAAVQAAAHRGRTADDLLAVLEARRKHALPANVVHEIKAWAGARKSVAISEAILVEGDDPLTLAEIRGAFPKDFVPVSPTALKYVGKGTKTALARKLAKQGFFA
jgi:hypothetical protein